MSTKRTPLRRPARARIDPQTLAIWRVLREIDANPTDRHEWEEDGGRLREYLDLGKELCTRLGLSWPSMNWPINCDSPEPPDWMLHNPLRCQSWREAYRWRCALMAAEAETL
jgi:hypothetical protein